MNQIQQELAASQRMPWMALLDEALNAPGTLSKAYQLFHSYSICNMMLAMSQTSPDKVGPIATFKRWKELGRNVRKGEKAIFLCMPVSIKEKSEETDDVVNIRKGFVVRRNWFYVHQTEGDGVPEFEPPSEWSIQQALSTLNITQIPFALVNGNCQGYACPSERQVAVSPLCKHPLRTLFHEIAHVDLHANTAELEKHGIKLPKDVREVEAETVSYLVADALGVEMGDVEYSRGYIQHWMMDANARTDFAKTRACRVFGSAQRILAAGKPKREPSGGAV